MSDDLSTYSVTLTDRNTERRDLHARFFPNEVAIQVSEGGSLAAWTASIALARDQVRELRDHFTRWLGE